MSNKDQQLDFVASVVKSHSDRLDSLERHMIIFFEYSHLPEKLQRISKPIGDLAVQMADILPDSPEKTAGFRKLLEAKDCFVRAGL